MKYVMLIYQYTALETQGGLSEAEQKQVYADYGAINQTPSITPACPWASPRTRPRCGRIRTLNLLIQSDLRYRRRAN